MFKKHFSILLLLAIVATFSFGQSIPSGTGRIEALGNTPFILDAATDIYNNPAWSNYYRNYGFGDVGRNLINDFRLSDQYAGFTMAVTNKLNLGLIGNKRSDRFNLFYRDSSALGPNGLSEPMFPMMILIGYSSSKNLHLGLAPYIGRWSYETKGADTTSANVDQSTLTLGANLGVIYMIKKGWIEGNFRFRMNKYSNQTTVGSSISKVTSEGGIELGLNLRSWIYPSTSSKLAVVPVLGFNMFSWNPKRTVTGVADSIGVDHSLMSFFGGVGLNYPILDDIQIAGGFLAKYDSYKNKLGSSEVKESNFALPRVYLAAETRIADWLTGRVGFTTEWNMWSSKATNGTSTFEASGLSDDNTIDEPFGSNQIVSLGAGFHFGRFSIDATVSEKWMKQGINFVSGQSTDLFGVISASYNFNAK